MSTTIRTKPHFVITLLVVVMALPSVISAEINNTNPIYVVSMQKVIAESVAGKAAKNSLQQRTVKVQARLGKKQSDIQALEKSLLKQKGLLSEESYRQKVESLQEKKKDLKRTVSDEQEALQRETTKAIKKVVEQAEKLLPEIAKTKNTPVVIERDPRLVVYVDPKYDVTDELITLLNKKSISF